MFKFIFISILTLPIYAETQTLFKTKYLQYEGLTETGLAALKQARDTLRQRVALFEQEFKGLSNIHHMAMVARMMKGNIFLYGPPGGAKTALIQWLFFGEAEPTFKIQLHQMMTEQALIGGQNFQAAQEGRYVLNTEGSLSSFRVALLDELEKGNPATLATLLSLLNEREVWVGGQRIQAKTETVFATSNANLPEIFLQFQESGQRSTAPALLNRFQFKGFMYNWLSNPQDQIALSKRKENKRLCEILESCGKDEAVFLKPEVLDWDQLRLFAHVLFVKNSDFINAYNELANNLRIATNQAVRESEIKHQKDRYNEPFVYFPSCDWTERLRQQIPDVVQMSALIDFLLSDWANDGNLEKLTQKQIELSPLSLWRAYLMLTTPGPGKAKLTLNKDGKLNIDFGISLNAEQARDLREAKMINNLNEEQERFKNGYLNQVSQMQDMLRRLAKFYGFDASSEDLEALLLQR